MGINRNYVWMCIIDFNDITNHSEKIGGRRNHHVKFNRFRSFMDDIQMEDLVNKVYMHTWSKNRRGEGRIMERLD